MIKKFLSFVDSLISPYPGFWINVIAIILAFCIVQKHSLDRVGTIDRKTYAIKLALMKHFGEFLAKTKSLDNTADAIRIDCFTLLFEHPEDAIAPFGSPSLNVHYKEAKSFLDSLQIRAILRLSTVENCENLAINLSNKTSNWLKSHSLMLINRPIYNIWGIFALFYLVIVGIAACHEILTHFISAT